MRDASSNLWTSLSTQILTLLKCFLQILHGTVIVHEAHEPKLMVIDRNHLNVFL
jgi:hypothetical protein